LLISASLAAITYRLARNYLLEQRESTATDQTFINARLVRSMLRSDDADVAAALSNANRTTDSSAVLRLHNEWFASSVTTGEEAVPASLRDAVSNGRAGTQRFELDGRTQLAVGVPIVESGAEYYQLFSLAELHRTLSILQTSLALSALVTTVGGAAVGYWASRRVLQPVRSMATTAHHIAAGNLDERLEAEGDRDLQPLTDSFNEMVTALHQRIEREARFASDVSHELRTPLAALAAGIEVVHRRRDDMPERAGLAVDVLHEQVAEFEEVVLNLLEVSRFDAGVAQLDLQDLDLRRFVPQVVSAAGCAPVPLHVDDDGPIHVRADPRRLRQALTNVLENASRYAGGVTQITLEDRGDAIRVVVDDDGPGIAEAERTEVFGRFARGDAARRAGSTKGSGLGLALVHEHINLHDGRVWIEGAPRGGARFVIELPIRPVTS
jgi:signal transduction histidine kinase